MKQVVLEVKRLLADGSKKIVVKPHGDGWMVTGATTEETAPEWVKTNEDGAIAYELIKTGTRRSKKVDIPLESWQKHVERSIEHIANDIQNLSEIIEDKILKGKYNGGTIMKTN